MYASSYVRTVNTCVLYKIGVYVCGKERLRFRVAFREHTLEAPKCHCAHAPTTRCALEMWKSENVSVC